MSPNYYLELAANGLRMPIGADLVLHEAADPDAIMNDPERLGQVVATSAARYKTPLAFPLMDLRLEKADLLAHLGVPEEKVDLYHFTEAPTEEMLASTQAAAARPFSERIQANQGAVSYIARHTSLMPVGMLIGPFSLMTKLVADPIAAVALSGAGVTAAEDPGVLMVERALSIALTSILRSARAQIEAGAKAIIVCEPAANTVYISPRQLQRGSDIFERFVLAPNRQLRALLARHNVDLIFHDCGELNDSMVRQFATELTPAVMSFGASRKLWHDASLVPESIVLFGNLPTKTFYSDSAMPVEEVRRLTNELAANMRACGHAHILGSECDVLHVPDAAETIRRKVEVMLGA